MKSRISMFELRHRFGIFTPWRLNNFFFCFSQLSDYGIVMINVKVLFWLS